MTLAAGETDFDRREPGRRRGPGDPARRRAHHALCRRVHARRRGSPTRQPRVKRRVSDARLQHRTSSTIRSSASTRRTGFGLRLGCGPSTTRSKASIRRAPQPFTDTLGADAIRLMMAHLPGFAETPALVPVCRAGFFFCPDWRTSLGVAARAYCGGDWRGAKAWGRYTGRLRFSSRSAFSLTRGITASWISASIIANQPLQPELTGFPEQVCSGCDAAPSCAICVLSGLPPVGRAYPMSVFDRLTPPATANSSAPNSSQKFFGGGDRVCVPFRTRRC